LPKFFYIAKSFQGEDKTGTLEAKDEHELARILHQQGLVLISANLEEEKQKKRKFEISLPFFKGVSLSEKMFFTRNLQVMISAGISLPRALTILAAQTRNKNFKMTILNILEEITKGKSFAESLGKYPQFFSELFVSMIKVGEESGTLEDVLKNLTFQMERENDLRSKIQGAMMYPAVIICAMIGIGTLMLIMVVPKLAETFVELGIELPPTTKFVIFLGTFLAKDWFLLPFIILALFILLRQTLKTKIGKKFFDKLFLKIPVISPIVKKTNSAQTIRTLSSLITAGVPIVQALGVVSGALGNVYFKGAVAKAQEEVRKGGKLSEALKPYQNLYPLVVIQMMEVGEETGQTADILAKLAEFYEEEVTLATKNIASLIEPILMLLIGGAVGFFAISMIQPMYSMLGAIQ
jgi:type IV pilus assembly protein PilC